MSDETPQSTPEPTQPESISAPSVETPISEPNSSPVGPPTTPEATLGEASEPVVDASISPETSNSVETSLDKPENSAEAESAVPVKDQNGANEPFESAPDSAKATPGEQGKPSEPIPNEPNQPNITVEKHGNDITITEVMQPNSAEATLDKPTASDSAVKLRRTSKRNQ